MSTGNVDIGHVRPIAAIKKKILIRVNENSISFVFGYIFSAFHFFSRSLVGFFLCAIPK